MSSTGEHIRSEGPRCRTCRRSEAVCAWNYGNCCAACSHWLRFDNAGNEVISESGGRRRLPVEHRTERGYQQHRVRHELPCPGCAAAHSLTVGRRKQAS